MDQDHSVYGYLQRRTTEELRRILDAYYGRTQIPAEEAIVEMILEILKQREQKR